MQRLYVLILQKAFCRDAIYRVSRLVHFARGIVAEPPAKPQSGEAGDGADSPTQAKSAKPMSEAARPNHRHYSALPFYFFNL
jgi:hypothetical protein